MTEGEYKANRVAPRFFILMLRTYDLSCHATSTNLQHELNLLFFYILMCLDRITVFHPNPSKYILTKPPTLFLILLVFHCLSCDFLSPPPPPPAISQVVERLQELRCFVEYPISFQHKLARMAWLIE